MKNFWLALLLLPAPTAQAFDAHQIEAAVVDYFHLSHRDHREADELARALSEEIALLHPIPFNDLVGHLLADYRHHPENRAAIHSLLEKVHETARTETLQGFELWIQNLLDDTFAAWTAAYTFGFGKGLWRSHGQGLSTLPRFREALAHAGENVPLNLRTRIGITLAGGAAGAAQTVLKSLEIHQEDPIHLLREVQKDLLKDFQNRIRQLEGEKLGEAKKTAGKIEAELSELDRSAPEFHGKIGLLFEDLQSLREKIPQANPDRLSRAIDEAF